jgi:hypothetical protein
VGCFAGLIGAAVGVAFDPDAAIVLPRPSSSS